MKKLQLGVFFKKRYSKIGFEELYKKLFLLALALIMTFSLAACGGETESVSLVDVTSELGISMKLPSDMKVQENLYYVNRKTGDSAVFGVAEVEATSLSS